MVGECTCHIPIATNITDRTRTTRALNCIFLATGCSGHVKPLYGASARDAAVRKSLGSSARSDCTQFITRNSRGYSYVHTAWSFARDSGRCASLRHVIRFTDSPCQDQVQWASPRVDGAGSSGKRRRFQPERAGQRAEPFGAAHGRSRLRSLPTAADACGGRGGAAAQRAAVLPVV